MTTSMVALDLGGTLLLDDRIGISARTVSARLISAIETVPN